MAEKTLTLALHGEVSLETFATAMEHWRGLVDAISGDVAPGQNIRWVIDELSAGSATATVRAVSEDPEAAAPIENAYTEVGEALRTGSVQLLAPIVQKSAVALTEFINGEVDFIRLETALRDIVVSTSYEPAAAQEQEPRTIPMLPSALGGVQGRIQTLTSRGALRFTLYDTLYDRAVNCYLSEGQEEIMRDVWGATAIVEGVVTRDPDTGRPLNVRDVWNVTSVRQVERYAYLEARGAVTVRPDDPRTPEALVSATRDE